jgi:hypothetical protein
MKKQLTETPSDIAYRGYLIRYNPFADLRWIERDGRIIVRQNDSVESLKRTIDQLLD